MPRLKSWLSPQVNSEPSERIAALAKAPSLTWMTPLRFSCTGVSWGAFVPGPGSVPFPISPSPLSPQAYTVWPGPARPPRPARISAFWQRALKRN
jgi:hypothetical protein